MITEGEMTERQFCQTHSCVCVCVFQPPQPFVELMADGGSTVWPVWELIKRLFGKSDPTIPSIGNPSD